jgi:CDP-diacylglycerol---serine O-phosphatidyltransferase
MAEIDESPGRRRRGIYLLPNLFTTGTLFGGFYAVVSAVNGHFDKASYGILGAMVADALDGRIARLTGTASDFGKEYDSLCDMVAFGLAASFVVYAFSLHHLTEYKVFFGKLGWVTAFAFTACAALRLARFNVLAARGGAKGDFFGLPSPAAAAVIVGFVWAMDDLKVQGALVVVPAMLLTWGAALLMVSNLRFAGFKQFSLARRVPFRYILAALGLFALFLVAPPQIFFLFFLGYALTGPGLWLYRRFRRGAPPAPPAGGGTPPAREPPSL